jgi:hypothetical protein
MSLDPLETLVEWMLSSIVLREMDFVSSTTSRLCTVSHGHQHEHPSFSLYDHCSLVLKCLQIGFQGEMIVNGLHIGGENLATLGDVER